MKIRVNNLSKNPLPEYAHKGDACVDLMADFSNGFNDEFGEGCAWDDEAKCVRLFSRGRCLIPTGLYTSFDKGMLKILSRSGLALKKGIITLAGVCDASYRGEIGVVLLNTGSEDFEIKQGDKIAQMAYIKSEPIEWITDIITTSSRGKNGFGSTGV